jgi:hypothetical protein
MTRRFNIGDRVIKFKPSLYSNLFHKDKYVNYGIVTDADDERFTTKGKLSKFDNGRNYTECYQTGKPVYGYNDDETFWFNLETEMELIENYHKNMQEQFLNEVRTNNNDEIEKMKLRIKSLEKQIERLESMENAYLGYTTISTYQHISEMDSILTKKINLCNELKRLKR